MRHSNKVRLVAFASALLIAVGLVAFSDTTNTVTNAIGEVFTVILDSHGARVTAVTEPSALSSQSRTFTELVGVQIAAIGVNNTTNTLYTPRDVGDVLIGKVAGTGAVWMATGLTTSDWIKVSNF